MDARPISFRQFTQTVLSLYEPPLAARATFLKMREALTEFGGLPGVATTADIDTTHIAEFVGRRAESNVNTTLSLLRCLRTASQIALGEGWQERTPQWRRLMPRPGPRVTVRHYTRAQVAALLDHLERGATAWSGRRLHVLASLVAYTGLRKMEALCLMVGDVDLTTGLLHVVARRRLKTVGSAAPVPVPPELAPILARWLPATGPVWLFPGIRRIGPWTGGSPGYRAIDRLRAAGQAVGIPHLTFHGLRHTLGKLGVGEFGLSADQVKTLLRHTDPRTTEEFYLHRDDPDQLGRIGRRISFRSPESGPPPSI
jgi:integrase